MRPRRCAVENPAPSAATTSPSATGFNAATALRRGEPSMSSIEAPNSSEALQCGHGASAVVGLRPRVASMRPRRCAVENRTIPSNGRRIRQVASMRPRRCAVENPGRSRVLPGVVQPLQCGHGAAPWRTGWRDASATLDAGRGFNAATALRRGEPPRGGGGGDRLPGELQCGHGAAPWRTGLNRLPVAWSPDALQCGHGAAPWRTLV